MMTGVNAASCARSLSATYFFAGSAQASSDATCVHWSGHGHDRAAPHPVRPIEWIAARAG